MPCPAGFYCQNGIRLPCPGGTVGALGRLSSSEDCQPVLPGFYAPLGSAAAVECPVDGSTFSCPGALADSRPGVVPGSTPIITPPVAFSAEGIQTCPAGLESIQLAGTGGFTCTSCRQGHYCLGGIPIPCQDGTWHNPATDRLVPKQSNQSSCTACPSPGTQCNPGDRLVVKSGYWMASPNATKAYSCPWQVACQGDRDTFADKSCAAGHRGALCGRCEVSYYRGRRQCLPCSEFDSDSRLSGEQSIQILLPLGLLLVVGIMIYLEPPARLQECFSRCSSVVSSSYFGRRAPHFLSICSGLTKICLGLAQCLGAISRFPLVRWPRIFRSFMEELDALNLELFSMIPPECVITSDTFRIGFYGEMLGTIAVPFLVAVGAFTLVLMMRWAAGRFYFFPRSRRRCPAWLSWELQDSTEGWNGLKRSLNQPRMYKLLTWVR